MIFIIFNKIYFFLYWHTKIEDVPRITISITTCISGKAFCCGDKHFPIRHCRQNVTSSKAVVGPFIINFLGIIGKNQGRHLFFLKLYFNSFGKMVTS